MSTKFKFLDEYQFKFLCREGRTAESVQVIHLLGHQAVFTRLRHNRYKMQLQIYASFSRSNKKAERTKYLHVDIIDMHNFLKKQSDKWLTMIVSVSI